MAGQHPLIASFLTISPVRSPVNLFSEALTDPGALIREMASSAELHDIAEVTPVDWPFGYGSLAHDALSPFFRPLMRVTIRQNLIDQCHDSFDAVAMGDDCRISGIEVLIYDDTLSILIVNWQGLENCPRIFRQTAMIFTGWTPGLQRKHILSPRC